MGSQDPAGAGLCVIKMRYKIYFNLINPPSIKENLKGRGEFLFNDLMGLIEFLEKNVNDIDFSWAIEWYKLYAKECVENFNPRHFYIDCGDTEWSNELNEGMFALYNIEKDPGENDMTFLYLYLEIVDCKNSYFINIKPLLNGPFRDEKDRGERMENLLNRYFYIKGLTKIVNKN